MLLDELSSDTINRASYWNVNQDMIQKPGPSRQAHTTHHT